jgi:opacity protein-like surface antigen
MGGLKALFFIGSAAVFAASGARAADMLLPPPLMPAPQPVYTNGGDFSGWYLRGDVGVGMSASTKHESTFTHGHPAIPGFAAVATSTESAAFVGFGAGYKFNNWFRADVTGEYRATSAYNALNTYTGVAPGCVDCYAQYRANFGGGVLLLNGYIDLGTWAGVTPFVGVGVGGAYNVVSDISQHNVTTGTGFGFGKGESKFGFAWALMAGLAYNVNQNLTLEMGYRYLDRGTAGTGPIDCANAGGGCGFEQQTFKATSHDLRVGMRWLLADTPVAHPQMPLIRKY